ncbi:MAG: DsbA family protein [Phycisphaerae bacterium]
MASNLGQDPSPTADPAPGTSCAGSGAPAVALDIVYWTDPLCCWSWGFEPQWRRLRYEFRGLIRWCYRMGGMIQDWSRYADPLNSINRPAQMGPLWYQAREITGMPISDRIWIEDPPASSYVPCIAVKAAEQQSSIAAELFLRAAREAVLMYGQNIARESILLEVAETLSRNHPAHFDLDRFRQDLYAPPAADALRTDLMHAAYRNIGRFPTLTLHLPHHARGLLLTGYRPYPALLDAIHQLDPHLRPSVTPPSAHQYATFYPDALPRELAEIEANSSPK